MSQSSAKLCEPFVLRAQPFNWMLQPSREQIDPLHAGLQGDLRAALQARGHGM